MPTSVLGRMCAMSLLFYMGVLIAFVVGLYQENPLGAITQVIKVGIFAGIPIFIISIFAVRKEASYTRLIPVLSLVISFFSLFGTFFFMFIWSFGG
ncbi:hypothetical protein [Guptibacillus algicola]|uniref:hypothetical protein n=1 Tax=Guptibacillus algicola TaxID=225844 RepID=UPI001CD7C33F|nr:hypothetical protein [Alkalihalobacillus algicola]MCA0988470.1 hypothetical protein [Alkalihalobacillus algicola]